MFLTETEAEAQLRHLHRERARLERAIADLTLFLAIGRQGADERWTSSEANPPAPVTSRAPDDRPPASSSLEEIGTDRSLARREGRLLMEAAAEILSQTGRPLHAAEILEGLAKRGLSVPGIDPVAALNTRLWKRSGPEGPFQRLGDAVYALSDPDDG